ncbi:hypothetical protein D3C75_1186090 [compost metagenome]
MHVLLAQRTRVNHVARWPGAEHLGNTLQDLLGRHLPVDPERGATGRERRMHLTAADQLCGHTLGSDAIATIDAASRQPQIQWLVARSRAALPIDMR